MAVLNRFGAFSYLYDMKSIFLNKNISRRVENGHPWIFGNEVNKGKVSYRVERFDTTLMP